MAYAKTRWVDNSTPAINARNLNKIESGIGNATDKADYLQSAVTALAERILSVGSTLSSFQTVNGWMINPDEGNSYSDSAYKLLKFNVPVGTKWISVESNGRVYSQYQNSNDVPENTSNRIGQTFEGNGVFYNASGCRVFIVGCGINSTTTIKIMS